MNWHLGWRHSFNSKLGRSCSYTRSDLLLFLVFHIVIEGPEKCGF